MQPNVLTAAALARAIADRQLSAREALASVRARVERHNPALNAIVSFDWERAERAAFAADEAQAAGAALGPLHGVPYSLKDCHATAGLRTTVGFPPLAKLVPERDATVAARLRAAGAILVGKTNVPPLLGGPFTDNPIFGRTNNPWSLAHTPGGSSGGAAAAVAARLVPFDIGSDALGSVRLPAHFTGLFGFKPSERRISLFGHHCFGDLPGNPRAFRAVACVGPLARSLEDVELLFSLLAGPDGEDMELAPVPVGAIETPPLSSLRVAFVRTLPSVPVSAEVGDAVEALAAALDVAGARVVEAAPPFDYPEACATMWSLIQAIGGAPDALAEEPTPPRIVSYVRLLDARDRLMRTAEAFAAEHDVFLCPPAISAAFAHGRPREPIEVDGAKVDYRHSAHPAALFNVTGQPAMALPYRVGAAGLPIGVQLVGRRYGDEALLAASRAIAELTGPCPAPPGFE